jgi:hypothetical protein
MGIREFFSGIASGIKSCVSAIGSVVSSAISICSSELGSAVRVLGSAIIKKVPCIGEVIEAIGVGIQIVGESCKILKHGESVQEIGDRALQAEEREGITLTSCNNDFDAYMEKLRSIKLDPKKSAKLSESDKLLAGSLVVEKGIELKRPQLSMAAMWPFIVAAPDFFSPERLNCYINEAMAQKQPLGKIIEFFDPANNTISREASRLVRTAEKKMTPQATPDEITSTLNEVRKKCARPAEEEQE